jgi:hypothetical protein
MKRLDLHGDVVAVFRSTVKHAVKAASTNRGASRPMELKDTIGLDLHKRESQLCILTVDGELVEQVVRLTRLAKKQPIVARLCTMPSIGPITALAFVAALDEVARFQSASQVEAYLGLVPSEYSSGDRRIRGRITKRGDVRTRWLLVAAGWRVLRSSDPDVAHLKTWAEQIARRRGKRIAAVALVRRIAGILFAMWRDERTFVQPKAAGRHFRRSRSRRPSMTNRGVASAMQLMAATEAEAQFWRRPSHPQINLRRRDSRCRPARTEE